MASSKIFHGNRALGYVSNHLPLVVRYIKSRKENLVVTCVGKSFHTYGCTRFTLLSVSGFHLDDISCIAADVYHIFTASGNVIRAWRRGTELKHTYVGHKRPVHLILPFGPHIISVDEESTLKVWDIKTEELYLELTFDNSVFRVTSALHPSTYLNKVLLGSEQGQLNLWNIHTSKLIYTFKGWGSAVTVLEQAPAVDVVAIGLASGKIVIHNIKYDRTVVEFVQDWGLITSLSFRTDGHPILVSGSLPGHIVLWNLEERKVASQIVMAHNGAVNGLHCLPNEPLMVSSSSDNSLKMWIFDLPDGGARLLKYREGHGAPPTCVRFHGSDGYNLLSSSGDSSLRIFSTITETFNKSLGRASYNRKSSKKKGRNVEDTLIMSPIMKFVSETTREKEWDNIAATHVGVPIVTLWSYDKLKMGDLKLIPERFDPHKVKTRIQATATSICLTKCGNFVVIGYSSGHVDRFNMQSGLHRETYGNPTAHIGSVRGVTTDGLNQVLITGGSDAYIKFWPFKCSGSKEWTALMLDDGVSFFSTHFDSSMIAVALEDFGIAIIDMDTRVVIRKFQGHTSQMTDVVFSPDSRWMITSAMDCSICTWDIPSGQLIDCFKVDSACTSLSFSPTGDLLASTHVDCLGIFLWSNRTLYSHVSLRPLGENFEAPLVPLPCSTGEITEDTQDDNIIDDTLDTTPQISQISEDLVTLSQISNSRWQNLLDIDIVKKRNKPKEPPKAPKAAPFFLPTVPSLNFQFDLSATNVDENEGQSRLPQTLSNKTVFAKLLSDAREVEQFQEAFNKLKSLGPSTIDLEVNSLGPEGGGSYDLMLQFMKLVECTFRSKNDFELAQAYLGLFLKVHSETIVAYKPLLEYLHNIQEYQSSGWNILQNKLLFNLCVVQSLKDTL